MASSTDNLAVVLHKKLDIRLEQRPPGEPGEREVLVRVHSVGICGSDVHQWQHGGIGEKRINSPMVMGHEAAGVVEKCGPDVKDFQAGDWVAIEPGVPCLGCRPCLAGKYNLCAEVRFCAAPPFDGAIRRRIVHPAAFCHRLPEGLSMEEGALIEPLAVAVHACDRARVALGSTVLVCGAGPIGLLTLLTAKAMGAAKVLCTDIDEQRLTFAKSLGATATRLVLPGECAEVIAASIRADLAGAEISAGIECSGAEQSIATALHAAAPGSAVVAVGMGEQEIRIPLIKTCMRKEVDLRGVFRYANCYPKAIAMAAEGKIQLAPLVTHRFPIENAVSAFETAVDATKKAVKIVIKC